MSKVRELTVRDYGTFQVDNVRGIIDPGKFEGLALHAVRDYTSEVQGDSFGDMDSWGSYWWKVGHRAYYEDTQGSVHETTIEEYENEYIDFTDAARAHAQFEDAIRQASEELAEAREQENGPCDSCEACMIQGVRCHETGCPRFARLQDLEKRLARLEDNR